MVLCLLLFSAGVFGSIALPRVSSEQKLKELRAAKPQAARGSQSSGELQGVVDT